jgi:hypothetical protein
MMISWMMIIQKIVCRGQVQHRAGATHVDAVLKGRAI